MRANRRKAPGQRRGPRSLLGVRSVVGQMFVLQVFLVLLLVIAALLALLLQARHDSHREAADRAYSTAVAFANAPGVAEALETEDTTSLLQRHTEEVRANTDVDALVVAGPDGVRFTHPQREEIGEQITGNFRRALRGDVVRETDSGPVGTSKRAQVPVENDDGEIVGLVSAAVRIDAVNIEAHRQLPLLLGAGALAMALTTGGAALVSRRLQRQTQGLGPAEITRLYEHHDAVLHSVREGVLILDRDQRLLLANDEAKRLLELPAGCEGRPVTDLGLDRATEELLVSDREASDEVHLASGRLLAINLRPVTRPGGLAGSVATLRDSTELQALSGRAEAARRRLRLLYEAGGRIGTTLDVPRTAEELVEVATPEVADLITVDLSEPVLRGEEPAGPDTRMHRAAAGGVAEEHPLHEVGEVVPFAPDSPQGRALAAGRALIVNELAEDAEWRAQDPERARRILESGVHALLTAPLHARGVVLGVANFWRTRGEPFSDEDRSLAEELVARTAVAIDNSRRYTREHAMAVTLQRSLLPRGLPEQQAVEVAYRYLPAQAGVGGDWFDVIPLSGVRVALVVGDVVGHGLHAAATMGRLRTAVHNFSALDLPPDELLGHLDELVDSIDRDETAASGVGAITGATCLYAIYDPVEGRCTIARAGHLPPALVHVDGEVEFLELAGGPPLGAGGAPFGTTELTLAEGSRLVLYTDGLVEARDRDIDTGLSLLAEALSGTGGADGAEGGDGAGGAEDGGGAEDAGDAEDGGGAAGAEGSAGAGEAGARAGASPEETCDAVLGTLLPARPSDDVALLVARTRMLAPDQVASWDVPRDPAAVGETRSAVGRQLAEWGLGETGFITELIVSELITNAIRYASGPIRVRLLRDQALICEVADASSTTPNLRQAAATDEGGRGLFLVSQYADRWGTRYTAEGKVIWAEQPLPA